MGILVDLDGVIRENNKSLGTGDKPPNVDSKKALIKAYKNGRLPKYYYITKQKDIIFRPRALEALKILHKNGYQCFIITNQEAIGLNIISIEEFEQMIKYMNRQIIHAGGSITAWYFCQHSPYDHCVCRKPKPYMIYQAANDYDIDLSTSWMIGDNRTDIEAGRCAGCQTIQVALQGQSVAFMADIHVNSLCEAVKVILSQSQTIQ